MFLIQVRATILNLNDFDGLGNGARLESKFSASAHNTRTS